MKAITLTVLAGLFSHFSNAQIIVLVSSVGKITGISANGVGEFRYENSHRGTPKHGRLTKVGAISISYDTNNKISNIINTTRADVKVVVAIAIDQNGKPL